MSADLAALRRTLCRRVAHLRSMRTPSALSAHGAYFGKTGEVILALKKIGEIPKEQKAAFGQKANQVKDALTRRSMSRPSPPRKNAASPAASPPTRST